MILWWFSICLASLDRIYYISVPWLLHSRDEAQKCKYSKQLQSNVAGRQRAQKEHAEGVSCSWSYHLHVFKLCTWKGRQLSRSTSPMSEQAALTESLFFSVPTVKVALFNQRAGVLCQTLLKCSPRLSSQNDQNKVRPACRSGFRTFLGNCLALPVPPRLSSRCSCLTRFPAYLHFFKANLPDLTHTTA